MGNQPEKPKEPEKTVKEIVKDFTKQIQKQRREFQRCINQLKSQDNKIRAEIKRMISKNEPRANMRIVAQGIARNTAQIQKYSRLDAQLADVQFQLQNISATDTIITCMKDVTNILKMNEANLDPKDIAKTMNTFMMQMEKQEMMSEQVQDMLDDGDMEAESDENTDKIIDEMTLQVKGGGGGGQKEAIKQPDQTLDDFEKQLKNM